MSHQTPAGDPSTAKTFPELVRAAAAAYGDDVAVTLSGDKIPSESATFAELDQRSAELAKGLIARGIGKPDLRYQQFPYDQMQKALTQAGFSPQKAAVYIEMFQAINASVLAAQELRSPQNTTATSFETFAQDVFAPAYHGKASAA